jgi:hypothetical protein
MKSNKTKTIITKSLIVLATISVITPAKAQWAVTNVNDPIYFSPGTGLFTMAMGTAIGTVKAAVDGLRETTNVVIQQQGMQMKQQETLQVSTDTRNRIANGSAEIVKKDLAVMPTVQQCIELTAKGMRIGAASASMSSLKRRGGGGAAGNRAASTQDDDIRKKSITSTSTAQAALLMNKDKLGTCNGEGTSVCPKGSVGHFAEGDMKPSGLTSNIDSSQKNSSMEMANYSMSAQGLEVAKKNMNDSILYDPPRKASPEQLAKNPSYAALYANVMTKLNTAYSALESIVQMRVGAPLPSGSMVEQLWQDGKSDYETLFPNFKWPEQPSLFEMLNFEIYKDFMGSTTAENQAKDEKQLLMDINRQMATNNFLALKQYTQTENTNMLLSHILVQLTTPVKKESVDAEYSKTVNLR